jgi:hypothetical protein
VIATERFAEPERAQNLRFQRIDARVGDEELA